MAIPRGIGIDIGTSYACVGIAFVDGGVKVFRNHHGNRKTPTYIAFTATDSFAGDDARAQLAENPENTVFGVQRLLARKFHDPLVQSDMASWPFKVIPADDDRPMVQADYKGQTKTFYAEEIIARVLNEIKEITESAFGASVKEAVITVPSTFNDSQRQAVKDAAAIAGLNVLYLLNGATAAAIAYGVGRRSSGMRDVLVFDLGGGTLNVSVVNIDGIYDGVQGIFEVKSTAGDAHLGGEDFDNRMINHFLAEFRSTHRIDLTGNMRALARLRVACEAAKRTLSTSAQASIDLERLAGGIDFHTSITRDRFEELCADLFRSITAPVEKALRDARLDKSQIEDVVLVGGCTRIPKVRALLADYFTGKELITYINPDEAVACGAAVHAAMFTDILPELMLIDVAPMSLGIETLGGGMAPLVKRNMRIPTKATQSFTTGDENMQATTTIETYKETDNALDVAIKVYEGEGVMTADNNSLGTFNLCGIPTMSQIDVTFDLDVHGILNVSATETATGITKKVEIKNESGRLREQDLERAIQSLESLKADKGVARQNPRLTLTEQQPTSVAIPEASTAAERMES